jgi:hypothetical protein
MTTAALKDPECKFIAMKEECKESACPEPLKEYNDCIARITAKVRSVGGGGGGCCCCNCCCC